MYGPPEKVRRGKFPSFSGGPATPTFPAIGPGPRSPDHSDEGCCEPNRDPPLGPLTTRSAPSPDLAAYALN